MKRTSTALAAAMAAALTLASPSQANDFDGAYVGAGITAGFALAGVTDWESSAFIGYNWDFGNRFIVGGELDLTYNPDSLWADSAAITTLDALFGYLLTEEFMLYGRAGSGYTSGLAGSYVWDVGAGGEYMWPNGLSIRGEFDRVDPFEAGMATQVNGRLGVVMNF